MLLQAMLYGAQKDKNFLAYSLDALVPEYSKRWKLSINSQEALYIRSLAVLLRSGLSVASEAITYMFPLKAAGNISSVDVTPMDLNLSIPPLRLHDTYQVIRCYHTLSLIISYHIISYQHHTDNQKSINFDSSHNMPLPCFEHSRTTALARFSLGPAIDQDVSRHTVIWHVQDEQWSRSE